MKKHTHTDRRTVPTPFVFLVAIFCAGAGCVMYISNTEQRPVVTEETKNTKKLNTIDLHLAQYSDRHITKNAIDTNDSYSHLVLADYMKESENNSLIAPRTQVAGAGLALLRPDTKKEYGTWIWTPIFDMERSYITSTLDDAKKDGLSAIYVSIDSYLDIYVMRPGPEKEKKKKLFIETLEYFVSEAYKRGIAVDAEAGWRNWGEDGNIYKGFAIINFVKDFNETQTYTFRGFQYDVEPYLLGSYQTDPVPVLKNFLALIDQSLTLLGPKNDKKDLQFSVVIPDFYDKDQTPIPPFTYGGETQDTYTHLLSILEKRPGSDVIIMSYRNFSYGDDGTVDISHTEVATATNGLYSTRVIIAQETGDVMPPYITFNNTNKKYYEEERAKINTAFGPYANFGGIAVHYVNAYLDLK